MTIFTDGLRVEPENRGVTDYTTSLGASLGATVSETLADSPISQLLGIGELEHARGNDLSRMSGVDDALTFGGATTPTPAVVTIGRQEAGERVKAAGLEKDLKLPDQDAIAVPALDIILDRARQRRDREATMSRGPQGVLPTALSVGTSFLVGAIDPLNVASAFIPVMGELRYGKLLADAGAGLAGRSAVRLGVGGAQGAIGQAALEPLDWYSHTQDGRDFGMADVLHNLVFGAALGGGLHAAGGGIRDVYRSRKGLAQYPFGPGEPMEHFDGTLGPETALREAGVAPDAAPDHLRPEAPGEIAPATDVPPALASLRDLPPRAQEDSMRAAIAAIVDGEPVKVGEMLRAAANTDPRIAESLAMPDTASATPPVPPDHVRFYHGHEDDNPASGGPRWVSPREDYARSRNSAGGPKNVSYVDIPRARLESDPALASGFDEINRHPRHFQAPEDVAKQLKPLAAGFESPAAAPKVVLADRGPAIPDLISAPKPRGRAAAHPDTFSLNEHLASTGGLRPDPELKAIYGGDRGPFIPGFGPLVRKTGMSLDEALSSAKQHGYMFDPHDIDNGSAGVSGRTSHGLTPNDLLDHLDAENRGQRLYKAGHVEATKFDPEQEKHTVLGHVEAEFEAAGLKVSDIDGKLLDRTVEIVHREGERDVLAAYERAILEDEERYHAIAAARDAADAHPGRDVPFDAGAAPGGSRADPISSGPAWRAGRGDRGTDGAQSSLDRPGDPGARDAAWRELAATRPDVDDVGLLSASRAADALPEPIHSNLDRRVSAAENADAYAKQMYDMFKDRLPEPERQRLEDLIRSLDDEAAVRKEAIERSGACLFGARV